MFHYIVSVKILWSNTRNNSLSHTVKIPVSLEKDCPTTAAKKAAELVSNYECKGSYNVELVDEGLRLKKQLSSADEVKGLLS